MFALLQTLLKVQGQTQTLVTYFLARCCWLFFLFVLSLEPTCSKDGSKSGSRKMALLLADRLMKKTVETPKDEVRVVFYGDGHFKPSRRHVSVPTKKLVKMCWSYCIKQLCF